MRIPIIWLKDYIELPKLSALTEKLTLAGHLLDSIEGSGENTVIDLELRGNRADCYSILGIAREVSALFGYTVNFPKTLKPLTKVKQLPIPKLTVKSDYLKRVVMTTIRDIKLQKSPDWLANKLKLYGIPSINNIVDLTNFVMLETGEPMHAFDLDKLGKSLEIRLAKNGEKMLTFAGDKLTLNSDDLVWANKEGVLSIAGAIGEKEHSISDLTKNILVEAASYDRANIRRTIHRHNLLTDAGIRHEKELDPNLVEFAIYRFLEIIKKEDWGKIATSVIDYYPNPLKSWKINLQIDRVKSNGGIDVKTSDIVKILDSLSFQPKVLNPKTILVTIPTYRTDVVNEEDVIEEILRIYGYENISLRLLDNEIPTDITYEYIKQEDNIKDIIVGLGFDEVISTSFIKEKIDSLNKTIDGSNYEAVKLTNPPSPDIFNMRLSMLPNLYETAVRMVNQKRQNVKLFEIGKIYTKKGNRYSERRKLGIIYKTENLNYESFKGLIISLLKRMNYNETVFISTDNATHFIEDAFEIELSGKRVATGGVYQHFHYVELDLDTLLDTPSQAKINLWPKYPPQIEDITLSIPERTYLGEIVSQMNKHQFIPNVELIDRYKNNYTFRIWYQNPSKTLTDAEVAKIRLELIKILVTKFRAQVKV
jgi:phenylalanyl-tRNA synthetase beta chain